MKNYYESDYALNKNAKGIVYRFADQTDEVTLADYLLDNPGSTEADFNKWKALSDADYLQQAQDEYRQTYKNVSIHGLDETEVCAVPSPEDEYIEEYIDQPERDAKERRRRELGLQAFDALTEVQRRRCVMYYVDGLTVREIANIEGVAFQVIDRSILSAAKKIKIFLAKAVKMG